MQTVSGNWNTNLLNKSLNVNYSAQLSFPQTVVTSNFFTIGTSLIGGPDIIKSGGSNTAFFDKFQYTDYSPYLVSYDVTQKIGQYPYGVIMATADIKLDNSTNLFTPNYDPVIGGYILAGRPIKLALGFNNEVLQQFVGFTTNPALDQSTQEKSLSYQAFDALNYIATYKSTTVGTQTAQRADQIIATGLAEMGFSSSQYVLDTSLQSPIGALAPYGLYWGDIFQQLCEAEQATMFIDENGIIRFWNRQHFLTTGGTVWQLDYTNIEALQSEDTPIFNDVVVTANPRAVTGDQQVWALGGAQALNPGNTTIEADFSDESGAMPVAGALDTLMPYTSATTSSYQANSAADSSGSDTTSQITISSLTNNGTSALIVVNNSGTSPTYLVNMQLYGTPAKVTSPISIRYTDATSVAAYGTNPGNNGQVLTIANDYIQDSSTANTLAYTIVQAFKDGRQRYLANVLANPAIQIGDVIQVLSSDGWSLSFPGNVGKTSATGFPATNTAFSVSAWFNANNLTGTQDIVTLLNGSSGLQIQITGGVLKVTKGGGNVLVTGSVPTTGAWHNVVYTFDATTHTLYLDGASIGTSTTAAASVTPNVIYLGSKDGSAEAFSGQIDTVAIWNVALAPTTGVVNTYRGVLPTSGLVSRWLIQEGTGTTAADSIGTNNLTISGATWVPLGASGVKTTYVTGRNINFDVGDLSHQLELEERLISKFFTIGTSLVGSTDIIAP